jgi:hypothetical protein
VEKNVIERLAASTGRLHGDSKLLAEPLLSDELAQLARAEAPVELAVGAEWLGIGDALVVAERGESGGATLRRTPPFRRVTRIG